MLETTFVEKCLNHVAPWCTNITRSLELSSHFQTIAVTLQALDTTQTWKFGAKVGFMAVVVEILTILMFIFFIISGKITYCTILAINMSKINK